MDLLLRAGGRAQPSGNIFFVAMPAYRLNAAVPSDRYDLFLFHSYNLGMLGCEERNTAEGIQIRGYFKDEAKTRTAARELQEKECAKNIFTEKIEDRDWNAKWRQSMKPARLTAGWWVSPSWLSPPKPAKRWIKIEPKMAFGTGHHETTRLAAQAIIARKRRLKNSRVLDIGTGSGVLCFVADRCGAHFCVGVENDVNCRENLAENYHANPSEGIIGFVIGSLDSLNGQGLFGLAVMNMILTESAPLLEAVVALLAPGGLLIWSGILTDEYRKAVERAEQHQFSLLSEKREHEWWCGTFKRS